MFEIHSNVSIQQVKRFNWSISTAESRMSAMWGIIDRLKVKRWRECLKLHQLPCSMFLWQLSAALLNIRSLPINSLWARTQLISQTVPLEAQQPFSCTKISQHSAKARSRRFVLKIIALLIELHFGIDSRLDFLSPYPRGTYLPRERLSIDINLVQR